LVEKAIFFKNKKLQEKLLQHLKEWGTCATTRDKFKVQHVFIVLHIVNGNDKIILQVFLLPFFNGMLWGMKKRWRF
jgi:hypothetical protein